MVARQQGQAVIGRELIEAGNAIADKHNIRWSLPDGPGRDFDSSPPTFPLYAGGEELRFGLDDVKRWGRLTYYGDAIAHFVAEVDGRKYKLMGGSRTPQEERFIRKLSKRLPGIRPGRGDWCLVWEPTPPSLAELATWGWFDEAAP